MKVLFEMNLYMIFMYLIYKLKKILIAKVFQI